MDAVYSSALRLSGLLHASSQDAFDCAHRLSYSAYLIQFIFLQPTYDAYFTVNPTDSRALCFSKLSGESNQLARNAPTGRLCSSHPVLVTPHTSHPTLRSARAPPLAIAGLYWLSLLVINAASMLLHVLVEAPANNLRNHAVHLFSLAAALISRVVPWRPVPAEY